MWPSTKQDHYILAADLWQCDTFSTWVLCKHNFKFMGEKPIGLGDPSESVVAGGEATVRYECLALSQPTVALFWSISRGNAFISPWLF